MIIDVVIAEIILLDRGEIRVGILLYWPSKDKYQFPLGECKDMTRKEFPDEKNRAGVYKPSRIFPRGNDFLFVRK